MLFRSLFTETLADPTMAALLLDAELGRVCTVGRHDLVLVVVAEPRVNLGLVLVEMLKAAEALR